MAQVWLRVGVSILRCLRAVGDVRAHECGHRLPARGVMAYILIAFISMAYILMACIRMAYILMAYTLMAYIVMAYILMAYIPMAFILMVMVPYEPSISPCHTYIGDNVCRP